MAAKKYKPSTESMVRAFPVDAYAFQEWERPVEEVLSNWDITSRAVFDDIRLN